MNKITLVGGSGFVGTRLLENLKTEYCLNIDIRPSSSFPTITQIQDICLPGLRGFIPKDTDTVVLLAAEHSDDVSPISKYYDVNVEGTKKVLEAMDFLGIQNMVFTSSVAVYGLNKQNPSENHPPDPFNHYGKSKWQAEDVLRDWYQKDPENRSLTIIRPTVIFGERNRGNVFNLLKQIASGKFLMIGKGNNKKSMAYVGNVAAFIEYHIRNAKPGYQVFNYIDKPDLDMNGLVTIVEKSLNKKIPKIRLTYSIGYLIGCCFDFFAYVTRKKLSISSVRVKKFCATTQFDATSAHSCGFVAPFTLAEGLHRTLQYEFVDKDKDDIVFFSE